ncbi:MAG TPA: M64 family metallopeptidase [Planctomycetota bacterium]|nr:M64 family metallopeptidase [Planctomycetota bacterium]
MQSRPFSLVIASVIACGLPAQNPADKKAKEDFDRAEKAVADAKYAAAFSLYRQLAQKYPNSAWGKLAAMRTQPTAYLGWGDLQRNGDSNNRVDVVVMGDGFALDDQNEFEDIGKSVVDVFRKDKVLGEYFTYHNFERINLVSKDQGVSGYGRVKETALGGHIAGKVQGQVGVDEQKAHAMLDQLAEHDGYAIAIVKAGSMGTGGGGIAAIGGRADDTLVHEWGHAFGGLSDEYSTFTGHRGSPRDSINVSTTDDETKVPWKHFVLAKVPGVGAYRGADGRLDGAWKPTSGGCRMENGGQFCPVCREQMVLQIYRRVDPIEQQGPATVHDAARALRCDDSLWFEVTVLEPKTHRLDVRWHVLPAAKAIRASDEARLPDRSKRGKLAAIEDKGEAGAYVGRGRTRFQVTARGLAPGKYQVVCRVSDDGKPSGQSWPWVLEDTGDLLKSERVWWIEVPAR